MLAARDSARRAALGVEDRKDSTTRRSYNSRVRYATEYSMTRKPELAPSILSADFARLGDEILFLSQGRLVERSPVDPFFTKPASAEAEAFIRGELPWN